MDDQPVLLQLATGLRCDGGKTTTARATVAGHGNKEPRVRRQVFVDIPGLAAQLGGIDAPCFQVLQSFGVYNAAWLAAGATLPLLLFMGAELGNSAIEAVVDRIGDEHLELSGRARDLGSAMVFMAITTVAVSWSSVCLSIFYFT